MYSIYIFKTHLKCSHQEELIQEMYMDNDGGESI